MPWTGPVHANNKLLENYIWLILVWWTRFLSANGKCSRCVHISFKESEAEKYLGGIVLQIYHHKYFWLMNLHLYAPTRWLKWTFDVYGNLLIILVECCSDVYCLLQIILAYGNHMNGQRQGYSAGFKLCSLTKVNDTRLSLALPYCTQKRSNYTISLWLVEDDFLESKSSTTRKSTRDRRLTVVEGVALAPRGGIF